MVGGIATRPSASGDSFSNATICSMNSGFPAARSTTCAAELFAHGLAGGKLVDQRRNRGRRKRIEGHGLGPRSRRRPVRAPFQQLITRHAEDQQRGIARLHAKVLDQVEQRRLGPVDVLEDEDHRTAMRKRLDPGSDGPRDVRPRGDALLHAGGLQHPVGQGGRAALRGQQLLDRGARVRAGGAPHDLGEGPEGHAFAVWEAVAGVDARASRQLSAQLASEPRLADPGLSHHRDEAWRSVAADLLECAPQHAQLLVAAEHPARGRRASRLPGRGQHLREVPRLQALGLATHLEGSDGFRFHGALDERVGCCADQDLARRGALLQPGGDVDGISGDEGLAAGRVAGDDLAAVDAGACCEPHAPLALELVVEVVDLGAQVATRPGLRAAHGPRARPECRRRPSPRRR